MNGNAPSRTGTFQVPRGDGTYPRRGVGHFRKSDREVLPGPAFDCTQSSLGASGPAPGHRGAFKPQHDDQCSHRLVQRHVSPSSALPFPHPPIPLSSCLDSMRRQRIVLGHNLTRRPSFEKGGRKVLPTRQGEIKLVPSSTLSLSLLHFYFPWHPILLRPCFPSLPSLRS